MWRPFRVVALAAAALLLALAEARSKPICETIRLSRYVSLTKYNTDDVDVIKKIAAIDAEVAKNCTKYFARGVMGYDLGLGVQLYNSTGNYQTAKILDFSAPPEDINAYRACEGNQPGKAEIAALATRTGKAKILYGPINACKGNNIVGPFVHVYLYNVTTKPHTPAAIEYLENEVETAVGGIPCTYFNAKLGVDAGLEAQLNENGVYQALGGVVQYENANLLAAYWGFLNGPPRQPNIVNILAGIDGAIRIQINPSKIK